MKKRAIGILLVLAMMCSLLTGCMYGGYGIKFNENGSGTVTIEVCVADFVFEMTESTPEEFWGNDPTADYEYTSRTINGKKYYGVVQSAEFESIQEFNEYIVFDLFDNGIELVAKEYYQNNEHFVEITTVNIDSDSDEDIMDDDYSNELLDEYPLVLQYTYEFPGGVVSVEGLDSKFYTISGNKITVSFTSDDNSRDISAGLEHLKIIGSLGSDNRTTKAGIHNLNMVRRYDHRFDDVDESHWFESAVYEAFELGIVDGVSQDTFDPDSTLTIAELLTMCANVNNIYYDNEAEFTQANRSDAWYQPYVDYAIAHNMINSNDFSDYNKVATRAEAAYILVHTIPLKTVNRDLSAFSDIAGNKYYNEIMQIYGAGVTSGVGDNKYSPDASLTRAQAAQFIVTMVNNQK